MTSPQLHADSVAQPGITHRNKIIEKRYGRNSITRHKRCNGTVKSRQAKREHLVVTWLPDSIQIVLFGKRVVLSASKRNAFESQWTSAPPTGTRTGSLPICESGIIVIALQHDRDRLTLRNWLDPQCSQAATRHWNLNLDVICHDPRPWHALVKIKIYDVDVTFEYLISLYD